MFLLNVDYIRKNINTVCLRFITINSSVPPLKLKVEYYQFLKSFKYIYIPYKHLLILLALELHINGVML